MAIDIAKVFDARLEYLKWTYGNAVLDLQSNKIDIAFSLHTIPARALPITLTHPMAVDPFGCPAKKSLESKTGNDLNKPGLTIMFDLGNLHETAVRRYCPTANLAGYSTLGEYTPALQAGRADAH